MTQTLRVLPNEIIIKIINNLDRESIENSIASVRPLKELITLHITDSTHPTGSDVKRDRINNNEIRISLIIEKKLNLATLFKPYHFFVVDIHNDHDDTMIYYRTHKLLMELKKLNKVIKVNYWSKKIDITYLRMFKSLFHTAPEEEKKYHLVFHYLNSIKCNSNHLLVKPFVYYPSLKSMNLYYCSPTFYFQVFDYLNLKKQKHTFPVLENLKIQDYMNEAEDAYSRTSDNHIKEDYDDYDDFDYNSDMDENEFFFDGLEIVSNFTLTNLKVLTLKNCNMTMFKGIKAPELTHLKILELSNKHTDAYDLNLINDNDYDDDKITQKESFLNGSVSTKLKLVGNHLPELKSLKIIGRLKLEGLHDNHLGLRPEDEVIIKTSNVEIERLDDFVTAYPQNTLSNKQ